MNPMRALLMMVCRVSPRTMLLLIVGLAAVISFCVSLEIEKARQSLKEKEQALDAEQHRKARVVILDRDVFEGGVIALDDLTCTDVPADRAPSDVLSDPTAAVGRVAKFSLNQGSCLSEHDLAAPKRSTGFQSKLRPGFRAVTFAVDTTTGVGGFVCPDSYVDIIAQVGNGPSTRANPILSDVQVVAVGTTFCKVPGQATAQPVSSVTVAVPPKDAGKLINAISAGRLYLTLRNDLDHTPVAVGDVQSLFDKPSEPKADIALAPLPPPLMVPAIAPATRQVSQMVIPTPPAPHEIEVWSGTKKDVATVAPQ